MTKDAHFKPAYVSGTRSCLEKITVELNQLTNSPVVQFQPGTLKHNVGHYFVYGGRHVQDCWALARVASEDGKEHTIIHPQPRANMLSKLRSYLQGVRDATRTFNPANYEETPL